MNPLPFFIVLMLREKGGLGTLPAFDTFKMELMLDRLHQTVNTLERVNRMNQITRSPITRERAPEILDVLGAPPELRNVINAGSALLASGLRAPVLQNYNFPNSHRMPPGRSDVGHEYGRPAQCPAHIPGFGLGQGGPGFESPGPALTPPPNHDPFSLYPYWQNPSPSPPYRDFPENGSDIPAAPDLSSAMAALAQNPEIVQLMQTFGPMLKMLSGNSKDY